MMARLRSELSSHAVWDDAAEWTVEANPETLTQALAADWRAAGVNRLSIGAQTFHEEALTWMGRMHGAGGPARAFAAARDAGIDNVSLDLIFGLPSRLGRDWSSDLARALELEPSHVSLYGLTAEQATPLGRWVADGRESLATEDTYEAEYRQAVDYLTGAGFEHYEVSNFARPGRESRHNVAYWRHVPYLGLGPGAHSYIAPTRWWNVRDWADYQRRAGAGESTVDAREVVEGEALGLEKIWLGLRARPGLAVTGPLSPGQAALLERWHDVGWIVRDRGHVLPTAAGWLLLDRLAVELSDAEGTTGVPMNDVIRT
jgi:oxygen-independent coproporphyrinogen-3 oxidase